jgi:hypothetical protein
MDALPSRCSDHHTTVSISRPCCSYGRPCCAAAFVPLPTHPPTRRPIRFGSALRPTLSIGMRGFYISGLALLHVREKKCFHSHQPPNAMHSYGVNFVFCFHSHQAPNAIHLNERLFRARGKKEKLRLVRRQREWVEPLPSAAAEHTLLGSRCER